MSGVLPFGKYLLDAEIARGGMARVFRARLRGLGGFEKVLVVKQILPELANDPRFVDMFVREANTLVQMNHPNIVPVYELGVIDGVYFLAMEHVEGATLAEIIQTNGALPPELVVHVGVQLCDALAYAHEKFSVVHRDVTPRNIIVDASGHVRLLDFGIAAPAEGTATKEIFGSHGYMPKEQIRGDSLSSSADVFALGASLFEAFTGKPAFRRENAAASQAAVLVDEGPFFATVSNVPRELRDVLDRTLARDADARPHVVDELGRRLRTWLATTHPEGVARTLGELATATRLAPKTVRAPKAMDAPTTVGREPSQVVRTLATSRVLDVMLSGQEPAPPAVSAGTERMPARAAVSADTKINTPQQEAPPSVQRSDPPRIRTAVLLLLLAMLLASVAYSVWKGSRARNANTTPRVSRPAHASPRTEHHPEVLAPAHDAGLLSLVPIDAGLSPARVVEATADATLSINAVPWAEVRLDGRMLGVTPRRQLSVSAGAHTVELYCPPIDRRVSVPLRLEASDVRRILADMTTDPPSVSVH